MIFTETGFSFYCTGILHYIKYFQYWRSKSGISVCMVNLQLWVWNRVFFTCNTPSSKYLIQNFVKDNKFQERFWIFPRESKYKDSSSPPKYSLQWTKVKQNFVNSLFAVIYTKILGDIDACLCIHICLCKWTKKENVKMQLLPFQHFKKWNYFISK